MVMKRIKGMRRYPDPLPKLTPTQQKELDRLGRQREKGFVANCPNCQDRQSIKEFVYDLRGTVDIDASLDHLKKSCAACKRRYPEACREMGIEI